ncbi:hypothetical protein C8R42DRAFT_728656 [Lentinula raphanica]|nr:hypothetical protein C8R42DRAFT_728656 [Lentinula raphanica]
MLRMSRRNVGVNPTLGFQKTAVRLKDAQTLPFPPNLFDSMADKWFPVGDQQDQIHITGAAERELMRAYFHDDEDADPYVVELLVDDFVREREAVRKRLMEDRAPFERENLMAMQLAYARSHPNEPITAKCLEEMRTLARKRAEARVFHIRAEKLREERRKEAAARAQGERLERKKLRELAEAMKANEDEEEERSLL